MTKYCNLAEGFVANAALEITTDSEGLRHSLDLLMLCRKNSCWPLARMGEGYAESGFRWKQVAEH
jgi:hypothetical protein